MPNKYHKSSCNFKSRRKSNSTFVAYIDESGDCGLKGNAGSSQWFVMSAYIVPISQDILLNRYCVDIKNKIASGLKEIHMKKMSYEERMFVNNEIKNIPHSRCITVLSHKQSALGRFQNSDTYYNYIARHLIEKITKCCSDWRTTNPGGDGCVRIVFSHRKHMNYEKFRQYLNNLKYNELKNRLECGINWNLIKIDETQDSPSVKSAGLQFADAVAHSFFKNVEKNKYGMVLPDLHKFFCDKIYNHNRIVKGYGLTILNEDKIPNNEKPEFFNKK
ncbi:MAG: DUF3800 domain-containing protein [Rickettsiales bacterium]|jgi:hypothetical protein|nr:DUF3800 domain-containing protein [Rickettsiales bacterium]